MKLKECGGEGWVAKIVIAEESASAGPREKPMPRRRRANPWPWHGLFAGDIADVGLGGGNVAALMPSMTRER